VSSGTDEQPPVTGHPGIDEALGSLDLTGPVAEHAAGIQQAHAVLQQVLNPPVQYPRQ
jgi:hypothetical protein